MASCFSDVEKERAIELPARDLPQVCYKRLGYRLSSILEELAYELNVDNDKLLECKTKKNPVKELLEYWASTPDTTVYVLYTVLNKMQQASAIDILREYIIGKVDVRIVVHTNSSPRIHDLNVPQDITLRDIIKTLPELTSVTPGSIKCIMESAPKNPMEIPAKLLKGKQISLSTCDKQHRTSEPTQGIEVEQPSRHTTHMFPIQESRAPPDHTDQLALENSTRNADCSTSTVDQNVFISSDSGDYENLLNIWPVLSERQMVNLFQPRLNHPGTYILRKSRDNKEKLSISIVSRDKNLLQFKIFESEGIVWLFEDQERFHSVNELLDYYSAYPLIEKGQNKGLILKTSL